MTADSKSSSQSTGPDSPEPNKTERQICLEQAIQYITKNRNLEYGSSESNFAIIAELITPIVRDCIDPVDLNLVIVKPYHVALIMNQLKLARILESPGKMDNWVDGAGYLGCGWECVVH
jgi:hypothetical protein